MLIFNYPYTDLYSLNLDWIIKAIKEVQQVIGELGTVVNSVNGQSGDVVLTDEMLTSILGSVVNSVNGQAGAVVITKEMLTTILEGVVNSFNGRSGTVQLLPADVNATRIDITWTSDPGDTIGTLTQAEIDALYADGKRILIFVNNLGSPDQIYFLTIVGDTVTPQPYTPTAATSGVLSVNGQSGVVTLNADNLPVALGETGTIGDALDSKQAALTFDSAPTANSTNPVTSGGVYTADQNLGNAITTLGTTVNQHSAQIANLGDAIAYRVNGNTSIVTVPSGAYVLLTESTITGKTDGIYKASQPIPANTVIDGTYLSTGPISGGGLNDITKSLLINLVIDNYSLGGLNANSSGYQAVEYTVPAGYKTTGMVGIIKRHVAVSMALYVHLGVEQNRTGTQTSYLSYYTPAAIGDGYSDLRIFIQCVKE